MLTFLRHHTTIIMLTMAVVIIPFMFWGGATRSGVGRGRGPTDDTMRPLLDPEGSLADLSRLQREFKSAEGLGLPGASDYCPHHVVRLNLKALNSKTEPP